MKRICTLLILLLLASALTVPALADAIWWPQPKYSSLEDSFLEEHRDEITSQPGTISTADYKTIYIWTYPGSGTVIDRVIADANAPAPPEVHYDLVYTDRTGRLWGYAEDPGGWVCVTSPGDNKLPSYNRSRPILPMIACVLLLTAVLALALQRRRILRR